MAPRNPLLDPLDAVVAIVKAYNASRQTTAALDHAGHMLGEAMLQTSSRAAFLEALASERDAGHLSQEAYTKLVVQAARLLKSQGDLVTECERIVNLGRGKT